MNYILKNLDHTLKLGHLVLKFNLRPKILFHKLEVNLVSRSKTIVLDTLGSTLPLGPSTSSIYHGCVAMKACDKEFVSKTSCEEFATKQRVHYGRFWHWHWSGVLLLFLFISLYFLFFIFYKHGHFLQFFLFFGLNNNLWSGPYSIPHQSCVA